MAGAAKLHPKRPARKGWNQEIFVHNTQVREKAKARRPAASPFALAFARTFRVIKG